MKIYSWSLKLKEKLSERNNLFKLIEAKILPAHLLRHNTQGHGYTLATHKRAGQNIHKVFHSHNTMTTRQNECIPSSLYHRYIPFADC